MLKNLFDGLLGFFIILSFAFLVTGNIARFIFWIKHRKTEKNISMYYYLDFWGDEWGTKCTKEEIANLKRMVKQFEEKHKETGNTAVLEKNELTDNQTYHII